MAKEHYSATHIEPSNKVSDPKGYNYDLTARNEGDCVSQRGNLDAAVKHTFSVGDVESPCHGQ